MNRKTISCILITIPFSIVIFFLLHSFLIYIWGHRYKNIYQIIVEVISCFIVNLLMMALILKVLKLYEKHNIPIIVVSILIPHLAFWYFFTTHATSQSLYVSTPKNRTV